MFKVVYHFYNIRLSCHNYIDGNPPPDPTGAPTLIKQKHPGLFSVDLSDATPSLQSSATSNSPVAFLFQFEDVNTQDLYFNWTVRLNRQFLQSSLTWICLDIALSIPSILF